MRRKRKIKDDQPQGELKVIEDFLPPPEKLAVPKQSLKVTLLLDRESVAYFKSQAKRVGTKYQRMMREVLKRYASHYAFPRAA